MSLLKHLKEVFSWNKHFHYFSVGLSAVAGILYNLRIEALSLITFPLLLISLVIPFMIFSKDFFSFKYLQSLPLSKQELYNLKIGESLISIAPLLFWGIVSAPLVWETLTDNNSPGIYDLFKLISLYVIAASLISIWSFFRIYETSRSPYVKSDRRISLRLFVYYFTAIAYAVYGLFALVFFLQSYFPQFLLDAIAFLKPLKSLEAFIGAACILTYFEYQRIFRRWLDEKRSYIKNDWKSLRDIPLMALAIGLIVLPPSLLIHNSSQRSVYGKSNFMDAIRERNIIEVNKLLETGIDINSKSSRGYTPLMAAAQMGDEKMYFFLLEKGASKEGKLRIFPHPDIAWLALKGGNEAIVRDLFSSELANKPLDGTYPLHEASYFCKERIIDLLLELGANPNVKVVNKKRGTGQTPLHIATEYSCLNGVISLVDAGAKLKERDSIGKIPADYVKDWNKNLNYYLERKSRSPAGR